MVCSGVLTGLNVKKETFVDETMAPIDQCVKNVLRRAFLEKRLTVGLLNTINQLSTNQCNALFCVTTAAVDSATHMQHVLLQAFCAENNIYMVKVDSIDTIKSILGCSSVKKLDFSCILVHYPTNYPYRDNCSVDETLLSQSEQMLMFYCCEFNGDIPIIKLPDK